jgi:hypothetical protein
VVDAAEPVTVLLFAQPIAVADADHHWLGEEEDGNWLSGINHKFRNRSNNTELPGALESPDRYRQRWRQKRCGCGSGVGCAGESQPRDGGPGGLRFPGTPNSRPTAATFLSPALPISIGSLSLPIALARESEHHQDKVDANRPQKADEDDARETLGLEKGDTIAQTAGFTSPKYDAAYVEIQNTKEGNNFVAQRRRAWRAKASITRTK